MNLPAIDIPLALPIEIPVMIHPPLVHFAIALPVIVLLLELVNVFIKKRAISVVSLSLLTLLIFVLLGAFFTGKADGKNAIELMSSDAKEVLKEHKLIGVYLVYASGILLLLKFLNLTKKGFFRALYILALIGFVAATMYQGKEGGELVFKHGTNVEALTVLDDKVFDLEEEVDELKSELEAVKSAAAPVEAPSAESETTEVVKEEAKAPETVPTQDTNESAQ